MLSTADLLKRVRRIEIKTRGLSNHVFSGEYHSAFKGRGMSFSEVREYAPGDDVRTIDWNVTARLRAPYVKVFEEERELTVMLLVDVSASGLFGTRTRTKQELATELCAVLAFSANTNNDKVGLLLFDRDVRLYIPPKKGRSHILRIIRELIACEPRPGRTTDIGAALEFLNKVLKKRAIAFLLSDLISAPYFQPLQLAARRHDLIGVHLSDIHDRQLPQAGMVPVQDAESGQRRLLDTADPRARRDYAACYQAHTDESMRQFRRCGARYLHLATDEDYIPRLRGFFQNR